MASPASAAMPSEEEIAVAIYQARNGKGCVWWGRLPHSHQEPYLADARAILALFAPILAEKERDRFIDMMTGPDPAKVWKAQAHKMADLADAAEARALAAESALAAERERCAKVVEFYRAEVWGASAPRTALAEAIRAKGE